MAKRQFDLIGPITDFGKLLEASRLALRGKRRKPGPAAFQKAMHLMIGSKGCDREHIF